MSQSVEKYNLAYIRVYPLCIYTAAGDRLSGGLDSPSSIPGSAKGESNQFELQVLGSSDNQALDFSVFHLFQL